MILFVCFVSKTRTNKWRNSNLRLFFYFWPHLSLLLFPSGAYLFYESHLWYGKYFFYQSPCDAYVGFLGLVEQK